MNDPRTAIVAGATGLIGRHLVQCLLRDDSIAKVIVVARRSTRLSNPKLAEYIGEFTEGGEWAKECAGADVFCALGTTLKKAGSVEKFRKIDFDMVLQFAEVAAKNGARSFFFVSSMGANASALVPYARTKGEVESALKTLGFPRLVIARPSLLVGEREEARFGERALAYLAVPLAGLFRGGLEKYKPIEAIRVAEALTSLSQNYELGMRTVESDELHEIADVSGKS